MHVLLVDDEEELVSALAERLSFRGMDADWALSGEAAIKAARSKHYDVAVLDMKMPRMGGIDLMHELKDIQPGMRFIFLTGHGSMRDFKAGTAEAGRAFYLVKPVPIELLLEKIHEATKTQET
ncbi:response regulator receiver protein [Alkalidesulfovibrio alkalitolerans DSM 16529]|uniref:Response regulator receiver protein n=1 Tax=Alkalidesulfovibrio alkalitolerans DSM 16529 TaxID=1121439 RepID=S7TDX5_9BACT|nr:response regulator [Alkalidesulfovibrio alkalitolerans]EPR34750.1 response regulator receiver protein [Alkalidesulfovibrio alkalitolerans DSM 16529]